MVVCPRVLTGTIVSRSKSHDSGAIIRIVYITLLLTLGFAGQARAQAPIRTWVASNGTDSANCSRSNPCRTFTAALAAVAPNGEVIPLDSAGYGGFLFDKPASILVPAGVLAVVAPTIGEAIRVFPGNGERAVIRGLTMNSMGAAVGISLFTGVSLHIENCVINGFLFGIVTNRIGAADDADLIIDKVVVRNGGTGIDLANFVLGSILRVSVIRSRIENNANTGLRVAENSTVIVSDSVSAGNNIGFRVDTFANRPSQLTLIRSAASANRQVGAQSSKDGAVLRLSGCVIEGSPTGVLSVDTGRVESFGDNMIRGNGTNVSATLVPIGGM